MVEVQSHISNRKGGKLFWGPMQIALLREIIAQCRSSLRYFLSKCLVEHLPNQRNVVNVIGGLNVRGAEVSDFGKRIITEYEAIVAAVQKTINQINVEINR